MARATLAEVIRNPLKIVKHLGGKGFFKWIPDKQYLEICYRAAFGRKLDLENPRTFNEKLQWLKLYDRKPVYTTMVDKYEAKQYVASIIGQEHIIPTYGVWDRFEDIDFDTLPNQFVLKCTHDSGGVVICKDRSAFDIRAARKKINKSLKRRFYYVGREWPYKDVKPRVIAEAFMEDNPGESLKDYKFYCFNGEPKFLYVSDNLTDHERARVSYVTLNWEIAPFARTDYLPFANLPSKPAHLHEMIGYAKILAKDIPFTRIDFYEIKGHVYFGEITFFPASGYAPFVPDEWDGEIGSWIELLGKGTKME